MKQQFRLSAEKKNNRTFQSEFFRHHPYPTGSPVEHPRGAPPNLHILLIVTHRALNGNAPQCITYLLTPYIPACDIRSEGEGIWGFENPHEIMKRLSLFDGC